MTTPARHPFLTGGGEAAQIITSFDWAATPLGPTESWPVSLKSAVALILRSPVPIVTLWGEDEIIIYNDAYSVFAGGRHPTLFGSKVREGWPEVADFNDNVMKVGLAGGTLAYREWRLRFIGTAANRSRSGSTSTIPRSWARTADLPASWPSSSRSPTRCGSSGNSTPSARV